ncbi:MAG: phenylacetate--CoA ligase family protein [Bacteroidia bacterium]|nr:phenylacetate--CoA ligase family protein [Bacteroidia bacterium]
MNSRLSSYLSRLLVDRRGGYRRDVLRRFDALRDFDCLSRHDIDMHVSRELAQVLNFAREHVSFYMDRIPPDISEENALAMLPQLPMLTKQDVQQSLHELCVKDIERFEDATGGSSGVPTIFYTDLERKKAGEASTYWSNGLAGFDYGDRVAMLWGSDRDCRPETIDQRLEGRDRDCSSNRRGCEPLGDARSGVPRVQFAQIKAVARNMIENVRWYNAFDMGENRMHDFHAGLLNFKPHVLVAYAGSLYEYAKFLNIHSLKPQYPLKSIVSSAEVLTPAMRKSVERVFERPIFDRYGNREFGPIAAECEAHAGLHINEHDMLVEIDSPDPYEIPGEIIVTYFRNRVMPFVRYNTGDIGVFAKGECACGRKTKKLKTIDGRTSDSIRTKDGKLIHGEYFTHLMYGVEGVKAFQFVQEAMDAYVLRVVCCPQIAQMYTDPWIESVKGCVGGNGNVRVEIVDEIPLLPSGKRKFTLSLVDHGL